MPKVPCQLTAWPGRESLRPLAPQCPRCRATASQNLTCLIQRQVTTCRGRSQKPSTPLTGFSILPSKDLLVLSA